MITFSAKLTVFLLLAFCLLATGIARVNAEDAPAAPKPAKGSVRASLAVDFCCEGCASTVREVVTALKGVTYAATDVETKVLTVDYREKQVTLRKIKDAILAAGYSVDGEQPKE